MVMNMENNLQQIANYQHLIHRLQGLPENFDKPLQEKTIQVIILQTKLGEEND